MALKLSRLRPRYFVNLCGDKEDIFAGQSTMFSIWIQLETTQDAPKQNEYILTFGNNWK